MMCEPQWRPHCKAPEMPWTRRHCTGITLRPELHEQPCIGQADRRHAAHQPAHGACSMTGRIRAIGRGWSP